MRVKVISNFKDFYYRISVEGIFKMKTEKEKDNKIVWLISLTRATKKGSEHHNYYFMSLTVWLIPIFLLVHFCEVKHKIIFLLFPSTSTYRLISVLVFKLHTGILILLTLLYLYFRSWMYNHITVHSSGSNPYVLYYASNLLFYQVSKLQR